MVFHSEKLVGSIKTFFYFILIIFANISFHLYLGIYFFTKHHLCIRDATLAATLPLVLYFLLQKKFLQKYKFTKTKGFLLALLLGFIYYMLLNPILTLSQWPLFFWCLIGVFLTRILLAIILFGPLPAQNRNFRFLIQKINNLKLKSLHPLAFAMIAVLFSYGLFQAFPIGLSRVNRPQPTVKAGEPLDVLIVGAGFSGIGTGIKLLDVGITNFQVYEKAEEIGGTWWHNTYPGLVVDSNAVLYSYSFAPKSDWSRARSPQSEIQEYIIETVKRFGLLPYIKKNKKVDKIAFDDERKLWKITSSDGETVEAYHVVSASGGLHHPNIPNFKGLDSYKGEMFHSGQWNHDFNLFNKKIAVIGSAASAVQIIPELAKVARQVDMYQRTASWVAYVPNPMISNGEKFARKFAPAYLDSQRLADFIDINNLAKNILPKKSPTATKYENLVLNNISNALQDPKLVDVMTPKYRLGCKRSLVSENFYHTLAKRNVAVISEGIDRFEPKGILSHEGKLREYDLVVMATGYKVGKRDFAIIGPQGKSIDEYLGDPPMSYNSIIPGMPNFYMSIGFNQGIFGSILYPIEIALNYNVQLIRKAGRKLLISVKPQARKAFNDSLQKDLQKTIWAGDCRSWYKTKSGHITSNYPYPPVVMAFKACSPMQDDLIIESRD